MHTLAELEQVLTELCPLDIEKIYIYADVPHKIREEQKNGL